MMVTIPTCVMFHGDDYTLYLFLIESNHAKAVSMHCGNYSTYQCAFFLSSSTILEHAVSINILLLRVEFEQWY